MTDVFLGIAALLWAIDKAKASQPTEEEPDTGGRSDDDTDEEQPFQPPVAVMPTLPSYNLEPVWESDDGTVCIFIIQMLRGMVYEDPMTGERTGEWYYEDSGFVIGNCEGTAFVRASASVGGTMTFEIDNIQYENVIVYATLEGAILEVEDDEDESDDPTDPQKEPEDDGSDNGGGFSMPTRPDFGLGGGGSYAL
jgi:hypothetical protein